MRTFVTVVATLMIAGAACGQFKANQTTTAGAQAAQAMTPAQQSAEEAKRIPRDEAIKMVKEGKAVWIDVRPVSDYDAGHIKGAINIPLADISADFAQAIKKAPVHKYLITYCA